VEVDTDVSRDRSDASPIPQVILMKEAIECFPYEGDGGTDPAVKG
jgi:hypothetical protein